MNYCVITDIVHVYDFATWLQTKFFTFWRARSTQVNQEKIYVRVNTFGISSPKKNEKTPKRKRSGYRL